MAAPLLLRGIPLLLRGIPLLRLRLQQRVSSVGLFTTVSRPSYCAASELSQPPDNAAGAKDRQKFSRRDTPEYRQWKDREAEILRDIEQITFLTKDILHSGSGFSNADKYWISCLLICQRLSSLLNYLLGPRYMDGERLSAEDEKAVVEKLLAYHPHSEDKIGCGIDSIMVDRHPQFRSSRCLFVVRTDGGWIDFSYQKCLRAYIRDKYPSHAERFIREHFKRGSGG